MNEIYNTGNIGISDARSHDSTWRKVVSSQWQLNAGILDNTLVHPFHFDVTVQTSRVACDLSSS